MRDLFFFGITLAPTACYFGLFKIINKNCKLQMAFFRRAFAAGAASATTAAAAWTLYSTSNTASLEAATAAATPGWALRVYYFNYSLFT